MMMPSEEKICESCKKGNCENCESRLRCNCKCNINNVADVTQKVASIAGGVSAALGGLGLTLLTGGLATPIIIGGALMGAGISSTMKGIEKIFKNERIDVTDYITDVSFGAITGIFTGGVGAAGETIAANVAKQSVKTLALRGVTGGVTGVTAKALNEIKECTFNDKKWSQFGQEIDENGNKSGTVSAWLMSAGTGILGGKFKLI
jgi:hypothetical protein